MSETALNFKLETFEGPLDLLLTLIAKNKVDILDIPIAIIFDQYMEYLGQMQKMDMDIAGEFIAMASELMLIKSRMLFPKTDDENEEDPRAALAAALIEYQKAKEAAVLLNELFSVYAGRFAKDSEEFPQKKNEPLEDQDAALLQKAFLRLLNRNRLYKQSPEKVFAPLIKYRMVSVEEKTEDILSYLGKKGRASFEELMLQCVSRSAIVAAFMAILELAKTGTIELEEKGDSLFITLTPGKVAENDGHNDGYNDGQDDGQ